MKWLRSFRPSRKDLEIDLAGRKALLARLSADISEVRAEPRGWVPQHWFEERQQLVIDIAHLEERLKPPADPAAPQP
jgi:hypothetical protein